MTERTLRDQIAALQKYRFTGDCLVPDGRGVLVNINLVLALLDAHTAAQPAPDAVAEADPADEEADNRIGCTHCYGRSANDRCLNCGAPLAKEPRP